MTANLTYIGKKLISGGGWKQLGYNLCFLVLTSTVPAEASEKLNSPLEQSNYQQLSGAAKRSEYLQRLVAYPSGEITVQLRILGKTVNQHPIEALHIETGERENPKSEKKLRVMLLAAQHGSEISGCEALLVMVGNWTTGRNRPDWLRNMEILIVPAANPDGIENKKRVNARGVNLSTDYGLLAAPESTALNKALMEFKPHVVLDVHESAVLKKKSLGAEGWLTDVEAQFEYANNPNVDKPLQDFSATVMLPRILKTVRSNGLRANHYFGEITRTHQNITHGGLSAHNFRNKAGLLGALSFLLENRLDTSTGTYPTPRNIKERVRKQMLCIDVFLAVCNQHSKQLIDLSERARSSCQMTRTTWLQPAYVQDPAMPMIEIPLRRVDTGELVTHRFKYLKNIASGPATDMPEVYRFFSQLDYFADWLDKQGIAWSHYRVQGKPRCIEAKVAGQNGRLLPLFLESNSASSILRRLPFDQNQILIQGKHAELVPR
ncbi:MAG: hypothetical protein H7A51_03155 [Akkermansiaceae bacterium]|nr:hypothetical protein [Akkermansiaceae bacterium]